jgi:hypothetical protein
MSILAGCGGNDHARAPSAGTDGGSPAASDGAPPAQNDTFDTAQPLAIDDETGSLAILDGAEDVDFYRFDGSAGEWVTIRSTHGTSLTFSDTNLTLYAPDRTPIAFNAYVPSLRGENLLARIVTRLPESGTYYVGVSDANGPPASANLSQPYRLTVLDVARAASGYAVNVESGQSPEGATAIAFDAWQFDGQVLEDAFAVGDFATSDDVDAFQVEVPTGAPTFVSVQPEPSGPTGDGSTCTAGELWVTSADGSTVTGRIDVAHGQGFLSPPLAAGPHLVWVSHPGAPLGANDFYVARVQMAPDNPLETAERTNDTLATAEPLAVDASGNAYILAHELDGDVDYFRYDGTPGRQVSIHCSSRSNGSGVVGLRVELRDDGDGVLASATETDSAPITFDPVSVPTSGKLHLRATKSAQLPDVTGDWMRCAINPH